MHALYTIISSFVMCGSEVWADDWTAANRTLTVTVVPHESLLAVDARRCRMTAGPVPVPAWLDLAAYPPPTAGTSDDQPSGQRRVGDPACSARYAPRLTSQGSEELTQRDVVRIAENQPVDEDPGMSLEHAHDQITSPSVKIVHAHDEVRVPRRELT